MDQTRLRIATRSEAQVCPAASKRRALPRPLLYLLFAALTVGIGFFLLQSGRYHIFSMGVALCACVPFWVMAERGRFGARELVVLAVLITISVLGRILFAILPSFKPVTAIIILCGIAYGAHAGFLVGSFSALVSNLFFGQGPWTPFQMLAWGLIGALAGLLFSRRKRPSFVLVLIYGAACGFLYSVLLDVYSVFQLDGVWNFKRYLFFLLSSLPVTIVYAVSNVIFLIVLYRPFLRTLRRAQDKYSIF